MANSYVFPLLNKTLTVLINRSYTLRIDSQETKTYPFDSQGSKVKPSTPIVDQPHSVKN